MQRIVYLLIKLVCYVWLCFLATQQTLDYDPNAVLMLVHCLRRWPNIKLIFGQVPCLPVSSRIKKPCEIRWGSGLRADIVVYVASRVTTMVPHMKFS